MNPAPIIPWIGGKRKMAAKIISLLPDHTCYCEPFAGGAAVLFNKDLSPVEVLNDVNGDLINLYRVVQNHLREFVSQFHWALTSRKIFEWEKMKRPETLTDIQRAARFFYIQKHAFGGQVKSQTFGTSTTKRPSFNILRIEDDLSAAHLRLAQVIIECLGWFDCVAKYDRPHTVFFCDPPYYGTAGYGVDFKLKEYALLAETAKSLKGSVIITVNDCPEMRKVFKGFEIEETSVTYTCQNARMAKRYRSKELIIKCIR